VVHVHRYARPPQARIDLSLLRRACWDEAALDIAYRDQEGAETARRIWPLAITYLQEATVVLAWCCLRRGFRKFRIERIAAAAATDESFRPRRVSLLRDYMDLLIAGKA
jgi:predicted DNA-binding transcriptional regulator YafY